MSHDQVKSVIAALIDALVVSRQACIDASRSGAPMSENYSDLVCRLNEAAIQTAEQALEDLARGNGVIEQRRGPAHQSEA